MPEVDESERSMLVEGASALVALGDAAPKLMATAEEILAREVANTLPTTIDNVRWAFGQLFDVAPAYFLVRYLSAREVDEIMALFLETTAGDPRRDSTEADLRRLQALFGQPMAQALRVWNNTPDDWAGATREIMFDVLDGVYRVRLTITKYSGEAFVLDSEPNSLFTLVTSLVRTVNLVPNLEDVLVAEDVAEFRSETALLLGKLTPGLAPPAEPAGEAPAGEHAAE